MKKKGNNKFISIKIANLNGLIAAKFKTFVHFG